MLLAIYTLVRCRRNAWRALLESWRAALVALVVSVALIAPYVQPYLALGAPPHNRAELLELCDLLQYASLCGLGQMAPGPIRSALALFD